ncbi:uncharacterized protein LOC118233919 isoform X3 [Anguilla anguilla]|nr:uncharacterized protein LOC118233919 isoform X3 [Anguilla anguilla]
MISGCVLSDSEPIHITGFTGDSVVLPCACTDVQRKPEQVRWTAHPGGQNTVIFPPSVNDRYKGRVQVLDSVSRGNLSLRLSDLTLSDRGTYRCEADVNYRDISLTVKEATTRSPTITKQVSTRGSKEISEELKKSILYATIAAVVAAVAVCGAVLFYCRVRSRKNAHVESRKEQEMRTGEQVEEKNADSVTYSTVVHSKTVKNTNIQNPSENSTEYASIKLGMSSYL